MFKRIVMCIPIGLAVGVILSLLSYGMYLIGFGWMFEFCNPFSIALAVVCTGLILHKLDSNRQN